jgi:ketosteroid isomerase-like protein
MDSIDEIRNLIYRYYHLMDLGDYEGVASLYGSDGILQDANQGTTWTGKEETLALWQGLVVMYDGIPRTKHCVMNLVVEVDEEAGTATAKNYTVEFQATDALPLQPLIVGRWNDTLRREDGRWRFVKRRWFSDLVGDLSAHLKPEALGWWDEGATASSR